MTSTPSRKHGFVTAPDGLKVSVREWGNPDGAPILLVHGVAQSHLAFARQFDSADLAPFRLIAYDVRGHGESDKPDDAVFYQDHRRWADEMHAVIGAIGRKPLVAGWSMGGRIIGQYLTVHGDAALAGIHFIASRAIIDAKHAMPRTPEMQVQHPPGLAGDIATVKAFVRACFHQQPEPDDFTTMVAYNMVAWPRFKHLSGAWAPRVDETIAAMRKVKVPTLIAHGLKDALVARSSADAMHDLIAGSKVSLYENSGHSPFWEEPERFNRELADFARSVFK